MPHYFSEKQTSSLDLKKIKINAAGKVFELYTASGVFSKDGIDKGTEILIENAQIQDGQDILDLGCGIGIVGIALKLAFPNSKILMADINERAVSIAKRNINHYGLKAIEARKSDIFSNIEESFGTILINPPQTAGKEVCFKMIQDSFSHLKEGGSLQLVARHNKGGATLENKMQDIFGNVFQAAKKSGFRVYISRKTKFP